MGWLQCLLCDTRVLAYYRKKKGYTQADLAQKIQKTMWIFD